jgi:hypothetical protein
MQASGYIFRVMRKKGRDLKHAADERANAGNALLTGAFGQFYFCSFLAKRSTLCETR